MSGGQPSETVDGEDGCCTTKETGVNGSGLWLFTRNSVASDDQLKAMKEILKDQGICSSKLRTVAQDGCTYDSYNLKK